MQIASLVVAACALLVTYIALAGQYRPHIIIYYRVNPHIQMLVELVVENVGKGVAFDVSFSKPLPTRLYGVQKLDNLEVSTIFENGIPYLGQNQKIATDGGQFGGIKEYLEEEFKFDITYKYKNPFSITRTIKQKSELYISHLNKMPTRDSADQALVDALKSTSGTTTLHKIEKSLSTISKELQKANKALLENNNNKKAKDDDL